MIMDAEEITRGGIIFFSEATSTFVKPESILMATIRRMPKIAILPVRELGSFPILTRTTPRMPDRMTVVFNIVIRSPFIR